MWFYKERELTPRTRPMNHTAKLTQSPNPDPSLRVQPLWKISDASRFFRCSERQVYELIHRGMPCVRLGAMLRFDPSDILNWVRSNFAGTGRTSRRREDKPEES